MLNVVKASGEVEPFSKEKVLSSIKRAGIPKSFWIEVFAHVQSKLYNNIPTSVIYKHIEEFLEKGPNPYYKSKYSLKKSIMDFGPTGFPFEYYVAEIFKKLGFVTKVGQTLTGKCVSHEVDIIATKGSRKVFVECKFHNEPGIRSDVHVSLYTKARFDDLSQKYSFTEAYLVTNTKITSDALSYALCENIKVISWSYPEGEGLRDLIEKYKLFPITQITSLSFSEKQELMAKGIVLIKSLCEHPELLQTISFPKEKLDRILREAQLVCAL